MRCHGTKCPLLMAFFLFLSFRRRYFSPKKSYRRVLKFAAMKPCCNAGSFTCNKQLFEDNGFYLKGELKIFSSSEGGEDHFEIKENFRNFFLYIGQ